jgi:hypothetical protein
MAKTLELHFSTEFGKTASLSIENPKEPVDEAVVKQSMAQIIASEIFRNSLEFRLTVMITTISFLSMCLPQKHAYTY